MARVEIKKNIWAVRWLYHHLEEGGLCLRPPWSMVEHIGSDADATNSAWLDRWINPPLRSAPPIPVEWPDAVEHPDSPRLWRTANPHERLITRAVKAAGLARRRAQARGRALVLSLVPSALRRKLRVLTGWRWFRGEYASWAEARQASAGYEDEAVLARVLEATLAVRDGRARFERDSVLFHEADPDRPLMAVLREIVCERAGGLRVLDFGGSLGSTYWRHRDVLPSGERLRWDIVEQPSFVEAGRRHLADTPLRFYANVDSARAESAYDVLLCSGVLQYLESPFEMLESWRRLDAPYVLFNNLPLHAKGPDRLMVQHVPPNIYAASYPVWFFNREEFLRRVSNDYAVVKEFDAEAVWPVGWGMFKSTGLLLKRKGAA
jgi:putative methyltransferase (TIGR04325 family)